MHAVALLFLQIVYPTHMRKLSGRKAGLSQSHLFYQGLWAITERLKRARIYTARSYVLYRLHMLQDIRFSKRSIISSFPAPGPWRALQGPESWRKGSSLGEYIKLYSATLIASQKFLVWSGHLYLMKKGLRSSLISIYAITQYINLYIFYVNTYFSYRCNYVKIYALFFSSRDNRRIICVENTVADSGVCVLKKPVWWLFGKRLYCCCVITAHTECNYHKTIKELVCRDK